VPDATTAATALSRTDADAPAVPSPRRPMPGTLGIALLIARKDLAIEFRTRSAFFSTLVFSLLAISIFYFAWDPTAVNAADLAPGVMWVIFTFSGLLSLHRAFGVELPGRPLDALVAAPIPREAIFLGKAAASFAFVACIQLFTIAAVVGLYNLPIGLPVLGVVAIGLLAAVGFVAVGTVFSAMAVNTRLAELLLPMLTLPFFVPLVIAGAQATSGLLAGRSAAALANWIKLLTAFDLVFVLACAIVFPFTLEE
jgi:heme exporter protein B